MTEDIFRLLTLATAVGLGLSGGMFFAFSSFVMRALGRITAHEGISAMQSINITVLNPLFFAMFFGPALVGMLLVIAGFMTRTEDGMGFLIAGVVLYLTGTIGVTGFLNVPLNDRLATVDPSGPEGAQVWTHYQSAWIFWNHIRTAAAATASGLLFAAAA